MHFISIFSCIIIWRMYLINVNYSAIWFKDQEYLQKIINFKLINRCVRIISIHVWKTKYKRRSSTIIVVHLYIILNIY